MSDDRFFLLCINHNLKRTARATTQAFDTALRPHGLRIGQFNALAALRQLGDLTLKEMGEFLGLDRTTLLRSIEPLTERGLIEREKEGRRVILRMTPEGRNLFRRTFPVWRETQEAMLEAFGRERWEAMKRDCHDLERIAQETK